MRNFLKLHVRLLGSLLVKWCVVMRSGGVGCAAGMSCALIGSRLKQQHSKLVRESVVY